MKKMLKKVVALALAAAMMIPATGISVSATTVTDEAIDLAKKCVYSYASSSGSSEVENMVDGDDETYATLNRSAGNYAAYAVYNGSDFGSQVDKIRFYTSDENTARASVTIAGTNDTTMLDASNFSTESDYNKFKDDNCTTLWSTSGTYGEVIKEVEENHKDFSQYTYIVVFFNGWPYTRINELTFYKPTTTVTNDLGKVYGVADVTVNAGTSGKQEEQTYTITDAELAAKFDITTAEVTLTKQSGIDRTSATVWNGNVQATVNVPAAGSYVVSVLGQTGTSNSDKLRNYQVTVNEDKVYNTNQCDTVVGTGTLYYYSVNVDLAEGENTLTLTGGDGSGAAPNFIALVVNEVSEPEVAWVTDTDSAVVDGKGTIRFLAQYTADAIVESAAFALVKNDGTIEFAFSPATATAFYADVTDIPEAAFGKICTAVPYVTIDGEAVVGDSVSASVNVAE